MSNFKINPDVLDFIGVQPEEEQPTKPIKKAKRKPTNTKSEAKKRSKRVNLALTPTLDDKLRAKAEKEDVSINQLVNDILEDYFKNKHKLNNN